MRHRLRLRARSAKRVARRAGRHVRHVRILRIDRDACPRGWTITGWAKLNLVGGDFWNHGAGFTRVRSLILDGCSIHGAANTDQPYVVIDAAHALAVSGCTFEAPRAGVRIGAAVEHGTVSGNVFTSPIGAVHVDGETETSRIVASGNALPCQAMTIAPRRSYDRPVAEIRTKRWDDPIDAVVDGTRILVCRYRPRGIAKADETWTEWQPAVAPSKPLHAAAYGKNGMLKLSWDAYRASYLREMREQRVEIDALADRVRGGEIITLLCSTQCERESRCHRSLLKSLIEAAIARQEPTAAAE